MKKWTSWLLMIALVISMIPCQAFATTNIKFEVKKDGNDVTTTITVPEYEGVMTAEAVVEFPKDVLELKEVSSGTYSPLNFEAPDVSNANTYGKVTLGHTNESTTTTTVSGEFAKLVFTIKDGATPGDYYIKLTELTMTASDYMTNVAESDVADLPLEEIIKIPKAAASASNYNFDLPNNPVYDGVVKKATITPTAVGAGEVSKIYYNESEIVPKDAGTYEVTFDVAEGTGFEAATGLDAGSFTIQQATPTITVDSTKSVVKGSTTPLGATIAPSTLALSYESKDTSKVTVNETGTLTGVELTGESDPVDVVVKFAGDKNYKQVTETVKVSVVNKTPVAVTFSDAPSQDYTESGFNLGAQFTAATVAGGKTLTGYKYDDNTYAKLTDLTVTVKNAGTYAVKAYYETPTEYGEATAYFTINKANQADLNMTSAATVTYGDNLTLTSAGGSGTGDVTYAIVEGGTGAASISGSTLTPTKAGTVKVKVQKAADNNYNAAESAVKTITISPKSVTITGLKAEDKVYNGDVIATTTGGTISGIINDDAVTIKAGTAKFADKNVETGKTVTFTGYELQGAAKDNYVLSAQPASVTADITAKPVTITGLQAEDKVYNGNDVATTTGGTISGVVNDDDVTIKAGTAKFEDKKVGTGKTVTFTGYELDGTAKGNYELSAQPSSVTANITAKPVTITGVNAENKSYDGSRAATVSGTPAINGKIDSDVLTVAIGNAEFDTQYAGTGKTVTFSGFGLDGADKNNYYLSTQPAAVTADITAAAQTITIDSAVKEVAKGGSVNVSQWANSDASNADLKFSMDEVTGVTLTEAGQLSVESSVAADTVLTIKVDSAKIDVNNDGKEEYNAAAEKEMTVKVVNKADAVVTIKQLPDEKKVTYGDTFTLKAVATNTEADGIWKWTVDTSVFEIVGVDNTDTLKVKAKAANASAKDITAKYESTKYLGEKTEAITVEAAYITVKAINKKIYVNDEVPALISPVLGTDYTVTGLFGSDAVTGVAMEYQKDGVAATPDNTKAGTYDIVITAATVPNANYKLALTPFVKGTLTIANKSSGGGYIPPVQKPTITSGEGVKVTLSTDGTVATITVEAGYDLADVVLNGVSKGKVTEVKGLKTGDKLVVTATKKAAEPTDPTDEAILATLADQKLAARSKVVTMKNGKKAVRITWYNQNGEMMEFDGVQIYRSTKKNSGYGKKPIFTSETDKYTNTAVKVGTKYYYKVRGFVEIDGQKYYTDWSLKAIRTVK